MIKEWFKNFLSTTAITIIIISLIAAFTGDDNIKLLSLFPSVAANAIIHIGLIFLRKINLEYYLAEMAIEFGFILGVVILTGYLSGWFAATPVWVTIVITAVVFVVGCLISVQHLNKEITEINKEIEQRQKGTIINE